MRQLSLSKVFLTLAATPVFAGDPDATQFTAELAGHAILPAQTLIPAPDDAPAALQVSGKYTTLPRISAPPTEGTALPFNGQPVQGFSGISKIDDTRYYVLTDNGFGSMANSPDAMLFFHIIAPNWYTGEVTIERTIFFSDPNLVVPFPIQMEATETRYLTGADFDLEGFQVIDGKIYVGDEFGPYIFVADAETGVLEALHETFVGEMHIKSPDHYSIRAGNPGAPETGANLKRSRGYEGFAASMDGTMIYPLLEGPLWDAATGDYERIDGNEALRLLKWDVANQSWTGRSMFYRLEQDGNAIGDFNMIDETRGLVIERDWGQGDPQLACADGQTEDCFSNPAQFKRVYMINLAGVEDGGMVEKVAFIDVMNIADPGGLARVDLVDGMLSFPFVTIEDLDLVDADHIIVGNDNNFPFSKGRYLNAPDNNELILLRVTDFLQMAAN